MAKSPDAFRTISEVSDWLGVPPHVLRFWETKFTQVKPVKRAGGRRYYRPADMALLGGIRQLLHDDGMTIRGVQKILRERGVRHVADMGSSDAQETEAQQGAQTQEAEARKVNGVDLPSVRADEPRPSEPANVTPEGDGAPPAREAAVPEVPAPVASGPPTTGFVAAVVLRKRDRDLDADARTAFGALRARLLEIRARLDQ